MKRPRLFLSHSARDASAAALLEEWLERLGYETFNPTRDVLAGDDWRLSVQAAIRKADVVLQLVASPESAAASWMAYEAGMAEALGKKLVLLVPEPLSLAQIPSDLAGRLVLRLDTRTPERTAREVAHFLAAA